MEPDAARTSTSQSVGLPDIPRASSRVQAPNMRNASRSISTTPAPGQSRRGGGSVTPFRYQSTTPFGSETGTGRTGTPLFIPSNTPFGDDEEDEEAHEAYTEALREGRLRLPSVSNPDGEEERGVRRRYDDDEFNVDDVPDGMMRIGERLVRSSEIEEGVNRVQGGWEERADGEESAVMGREDPDE